MKSKIYKTFVYIADYPDESFSSSEDNVAFQQAVDDKIESWYLDQLNESNNEFSIPECGECNNAYYLEPGYLSKSLKDALDDNNDDCYGKIIYEYEVDANQLIDALTEHYEAKVTPVAVYLYIWNESNKKLEFSKSKPFMR